jgi:hypothetical protein
VLGRPSAPPPAPGRQTKRRRTRSRRAAPRRANPTAGPEDFARRITYCHVCGADRTAPPSSEEWASRVAASVFAPHVSAITQRLATIARRGWAQVSVGRISEPIPAGCYLGAVAVVLWVLMTRQASLEAAGTNSPSTRRVYAWADAITDEQTGAPCYVLSPRERGLLLAAAVTCLRSEVVTEAVNEWGWNESALLRAAWDWAGGRARTRGEGTSVGSREHCHPERRIGASMADVYFEFPTHDPFRARVPTRRSTGSGSSVLRPLLSRGTGARGTGGLHMSAAQARRPAGPTWRTTATTRGVNRPAAGLTSCTLPYCRGVAPYRLSEPLADGRAAVASRSVTTLALVSRRDGQ